VLPLALLEELAQAPTRAISPLTFAELFVEFDPAAYAPVTETVIMTAPAKPIINTYFNLQYHFHINKYLSIVIPSDSNEISRLIEQ
jgi:hypothetical protein